MLSDKIFALKFILLHVTNSLNLSILQVSIKLLAFFISSFYSVDKIVIFYAAKRYATTCCTIMKSCSWIIMMIYMMTKKYASNHRLQLL
jgi:hypothetical protein